VPDAVRNLRLNAVELLRQPGATRSIELAIAPDDLDVVHDAVAGDLAVDLGLTVLDEGIAVTGSVSVPWSGECRLCLRPIDGLAVADVEELYQSDVTADGAEPINGGQLDLAPVLRQVVLIEVGGERQCRAECAGLCPACGVDRNAETCECDTTARDERWAALDGLVLDD
jgi:uncharacterized protein